MSYLLIACWSATIWDHVHVYFHVTRVILQSTKRQVPLPLDSDPTGSNGHEKGESETTTHDPTVRLSAVGPSFVQPAPQPRTGAPSAGTLVVAFEMEANAAASRTSTW